MKMEPSKSKMKDLFKPPPAAAGNVEQLEIRPGGMLVQKRNSDESNEIALPIPKINVRVKYGASYLQIYINSIASFGELKKIVAERTGVHHLDQKLIYKKKERDSKSFLDVAGVKNGSKMVMIEDITSRERRCLESLKSAKIDKVSKLLQQISLQVDKLRPEVISMEESGKVADSDIDNLTGILMNKLVILDGISADGELKLKKEIQVRRVQKYIEILDMLKLKKSKAKIRIPIQQQEKQNNVKANKPLKEIELMHLESVVVTTKWEIFD
ncbi:BAG family molecular chaperone regulator 1-like [Euphorbia lathyris]|uniref:BAG family molecular chaperone regulator 1-like n=1 Tax=Euphorbia lathyris TaxID=212925 RepID=UPI0033143B05